MAMSFLRWGLEGQRVGRRQGEECRFSQAQQPSVILDHDADVIRIVERHYNAIESGIIDVPRTLGVPHCSRGESCKDEIVLFHIRQMAAEACVVLRLVDRLAVDKTAESPPARSGVPFRVFDHDLHCRSRAVHGGPLDLRGRDALPGQFDENGPIRKGKGTLPVRFHR
jgi:hypothetical protein